MSLLRQDARIYIAGHKGMLGSAIWRSLERQGYRNLGGLTSSQLDLRNPLDVLDAMHEEKPDALVLAAARVGGIQANVNSPVEFMNENLRIQTNVFEAAHQAGVNRLLFIASSCAYPPTARQPFKEDSLLTGPLEPTNASYALAKIAGMHVVSAYRTQYERNWISAIPCNLYGPQDNFDPVNSHVLAALIARFVQAKANGDDRVVLWGSGAPRREFLHVDDCADACVLLLRTYSSDTPINVGSGEDLEISRLAHQIAKIVGYQGEIRWDANRPEGMMRKILDSGFVRQMGWKPRIALEEGLQATIDWYRAHTRQ